MKIEGNIKILSDPHFAVIGLPHDLNASANEP